jgi:hypothetical protein
VPHVFARLSGHGIVVVPRPHFRIDRVAGAPDGTLRIADASGEEIVDLLLVARGERSCAKADVHRGPRTGAFRIETGITTCAWPRDFALSHDPDDISPFLLLGPREAMVWIAGPIARAKVEPIEKLVEGSQSVRAVAEAQGASRIDVDYDHDGERWWQRRYVIAWGDPSSETALVISGQARAEDEAQTSAAVDEIERTLAPYRPD